VTDCFYEWKKITVKEKQPYAIGMTDGMMIIAGLCSRWKDPKSGDEVLSCTVLKATDDELLGFLKPCPDDALKIWPVGKAVGNVKNTGPQLAMLLAG
jgi:putative SOS response-associated peptidase YedK